jgi:hypothetical protein
MKKQWRLFIDSYIHPSGKWLLSALLGLTLLPFLLKSVIMLIRQAALPGWLTLAAQLTGWLAAWFFLYISVRSHQQQKTERFWRGLCRATLTSGLWLLAIALALDALNTLYLSKGGLMAVRGSTGWFLLGLILVMLVSSLVLSGAVWHLAVRLRDPHHQIRLGPLLAYWLRRPLLVIGSALALGATIFALPLTEDKILAWLPWNNISLLWVMTDILLLTIMAWLILQPLAAILSHHAARLANEAMTTAAAAAARPARPLSMLAPPLAAMLLILAVVISNLGSGQPTSPVDLIRSDIQSNLSNARMMETAGDLAAAAYYSKIAEARILAWQEAVLEEPGALQRALALAPDDEQVQLLAALQSVYKRQILEQGLFMGQHSPAWHLALLESYRTDGQLTGQQELIRSELLRLCILQENFSQTTVLPQDLAKNKNELAKALNELKAELANFRHCALIARQGEEGGINRQLVLDTLDMAEAYPGQIKLQQLAMLYGSSFLEDFASHYERTAAAALRFDKLFEESKTADLGEDSIVAEKLRVAKALMDCNQFETCARFLSEQKVKHPALDKMEANCLYRLKSYDQCLAVARRLLDSEPDDARSLYLAASCALQLKDTTTSLEYAIRLAELVKSSKDPQPAESLLYPWLLRFTLNENQAGYNNATYENLDETQKEMLASHPFLNTYATAMHLWTKNDAASRSLALEQIAAVLAVRPDLSRALYVQGALYYELQDNEKALSSLKASLALDAEQPTAWYALATLHDRMGNYQESYAACQKVLEYLPSTDHTNDLFGVSIHATWLMEKLAPLIKEVD